MKTIIITIGLAVVLTGSLLYVAESQYHSQDKKIANLSSTPTPIQEVAAETIEPTIEPTATETPVRIYPTATPISPTLTPIPTSTQISITKINTSAKNTSQSLVQQQSKNESIDYTQNYNNTLKYFTETENCYSIAINEAKANNFVSMTATVDQCHILLSYAEKELRKIKSLTYSRVASNLGSAWGYYLNVLNSMWTLKSSFAYPDSFTNDLQEKEKTISTARSFVNGAKQEWENIK